MSGFMHSVKHYAAVARAFAEGAELPEDLCMVENGVGEFYSLRNLLRDDPVLAVNQMALENAASVSHRYSEDVEAVQVTSEDLESAPALSTRNLKVALMSIDHQSCEHEGWKARGWEAAFKNLIGDEPKLGPGRETSWEIK